MGSDRYEAHKNKETELKKTQRAERSRSEKKTRSMLGATSQLAIDFDEVVNDYVKNRKGKNTVGNAIGWVGGKWKMGKTLINMMPEHDYYCEVFFGGGSVFFRKVKSEFNAINDYNANLINMYNQLRDNKDNFLKYINTFLYSRDIFDYCRERYGEDDWFEVGEIVRAVMFYYMIRVSFNNQMTHFSKDQKYSIWDEYHRIVKISEKLQNVLIENRDYRKFITDRIEDKVGDKKMFYLDPPYVIAEGKGYYEYLFSNMEHSELAHLCDRIHKEGHYFMLSYENTQIIRDLYRSYELTDLEWKYSMGASRDGTQKMGKELIVTNFKIPNQQLEIL